MARLLKRAREKLKGNLIMRAKILAAADRPRLAAARTGDGPIAIGGGRRADTGTSPKDGSSGVHKAAALDVDACAEGATVSYLGYRESRAGGRLTGSPTNLRAVRSTAATAVVAHLHPARCFRIAGDGAWVTDDDRSPGRARNPRVCWVLAVSLQRRPVLRAG